MVANFYPLHKGLRMRKILWSIALSISIVQALTLENVRADLRKSMMTSDSVEMGIRTTVSSSAMSSSQGMTMYLVRKGPAKIYAEVKMPMMNQRTIINGNRMKSIDLDSRKYQVLPYNGESFPMMSYANFNPLDSGEWSEPRLVSGSLYSIKGEKGTLYYDSKKKRIDKMEAEDLEKSTSTEFSYDAENNLKTMTIRVSVQGIETTIVTEILKLRHSRDFPDRLFEF